MIVFCEECGKRYHVNAEKIQGNHAKAKCKACGHVISISRTEDQTEISAWPMSEKEEAAFEETKDTETEEGLKREFSEVNPDHSRHFGLRAKMMALFFVVPIALMIAAGFLYLQKLDQLSSLITSESSRVVRHLGENIIRDKAESVASQVRLYLLSHKNLRKERFNDDAGFRKIAVQQVGITGYTALYEMPDQDGVWRTWAHPNPKIVGIDMSKLRKPLGKNFPGFWKIYTGVETGRPSKGYYAWQDKDGRIRNKFMVCVPVPNTPFVVAATTYLDEFTQNVKRLQIKAAGIASDTRHAVMMILGGMVALIGFLVLLFGNVVTGRIKSLTASAEQISLGALDVELSVHSKDEIGDLSEAIGRMQESIRISMERLRRKR